VRCQTAGDTETDHAPVTLPDGIVGDGFEFAAGRSANHLHTGSGGNSRFEGQADERDDETAGTIDGGRSFRNPNGVIGFSYKSIDKRSPGII
jgi:hypothetical protein